ncbi:FAD-dependent oxidoreductase [Rhabdaerophilum sp. SD176]|uniref:NAD(P)/FAD-dependent oxidoreductase n=1 Tax=Rhabdaerophilum sp. SD176 TaxID=2983548 RepID=UPI0024DF8AC3|nr:FAD-dependent oxidoreductase [Rhabdaerophilum sp. SD176]
MEHPIVIIGSGMAGLACARQLAAAGPRPLVLDKGRGVGGRMATRRVEIAGHACGFDHGAQYFTIRDPEFRAALSPVADAIAPWDEGGSEPRFVGRPGMSGLQKAMAEGIDLRQGIEVLALGREGSAWRLETGGGPILARHLVMTMPAPQAARLLGRDHPLTARLDSVRIAPCLALMAAFPAEAPRPFPHRSSETEPLSWIAQDSSKPGRHAGLTCWVAQAGPDWSAANLEESPDSLARLMLPLLAKAIGADPERALHASAHRWRYARVTAPLGEPYLGDDDSTLWLGGDWCLGARVEAAWQSGTALAQALMRHLHAG